MPYGPGGRRRRRAALVGRGRVTAARVATVEAQVQFAHGDRCAEREERSRRRRVLQSRIGLISLTKYDAGIRGGFPAEQRFHWPGMAFITQGTHASGACTNPQLH